MSVKLLKEILPVDGIRLGVAASGERYENRNDLLVQVNELGCVSNLRRNRDVGEVTLMESSLPFSRSESVEGEFPSFRMENRFSWQLVWSSSGQITFNFLATSTIGASVSNFFIIFAVNFF